MWEKSFFINVLMACRKPLGHYRKNSFPTLIFLIDTFTKQFVDSVIIAVHTNLLAIE